MLVPSSKLEKFPGNSLNFMSLHLGIPCTLKKAGGYGYTGELQHPGGTVNSFLRSRDSRLCCLAEHGIEVKIPGSRAGCRPLAVW